MDNISNDIQNAQAGLLRERNPAAVEGWFLENADALYTFVYYRVGRDESVACDVVQETFTTALKRITDFDPGRGTMIAWLTTLSKNIIRKALKDKGQYQTWERIDQALLTAYTNLANAPLPQEALDRQETAHLVRMTLQSIPGNYQDVLKQHYYHEKPLTQIADSLKITEGAVKSLLHRARLAFKDAFCTLAHSIVPIIPTQGGSHDDK